MGWVQSTTAQQVLCILFYLFCMLWLLSTILLLIVNYLIIISMGIISISTIIIIIIIDVNQFSIVHRPNYLIVSTIDPYILLVILHVLALILLATPAAGYSHR